MILIMIQLIILKTEFEFHLEINNTIIDKNNRKVDEKMKWPYNLG